MEHQQNKILWVDDIRNPPTGMQVDIARTYNDAIKLLTENQYDTIWLDHDLGDYTGPEGREMTGYDVVMWIVECKLNGAHVPLNYEYLTANPVGRKNMDSLIVRYLTP